MTAGDPQQELVELLAKSARGPGVKGYSPSGSRCG